MRGGKSTRDITCILVQQVTYPVQRILSSLCYEFWMLTVRIDRLADGNHRLLPQLNLRAIKAQSGLQVPALTRQTTLTT